MFSCSLVAHKRISKLIDVFKRVGATFKFIILLEDSLGISDHGGAITSRPPAAEIYTCQSMLGTKKSLLAAARGRLEPKSPYS